MQLQQEAFSTTCLGLPKLLKEKLKKLSIKPKKRFLTKPTRSSKEKRIQMKKIQSQKKALRKKPKADNES